MARRVYDPDRDPTEQIRAMDGAQELFVPVHGHVLLYPEEIAIIDHPFVECCCWNRMSEVAKQHLRSVIQCFFFQDDQTVDLKVVRSQVDVSIRTVREDKQLVAFRGTFGNPPAVEKFRGFTFPSGLTFDIAS